MLDCGIERVVFISLGSDFRKWTLLTEAKSLTIA